MVHDEAERLDADFPFADMLVAVHMRIKRDLGIVEVKRREMLEADRFVKLREYFFRPFRRGDIVARGKNVRSIESRCKGARARARFS